MRINSDTSDQQIRGRPLLVVVALGTILAPLNSTMIAVALPSIGQEFGIAVARASWLIIAYLIAMAVVQPIAGRLGDLYGRRPLFLGALAGFLVFSLAAGFASSFTLLVALRIIQAVCAALAIPNGTAMVRASVPSARIGAALGTIGAATGLAAGLGPPLGGVIVGVGGWRAIFLVNVPIVAVALVLGWFSLPRLRSRAPASGAFDLAGASLLLLWLGALALAAASIRTRIVGLSPASLAAITVLALAAFIWREARVEQPVVHLELFRVRAFAAAAVAVGFGNFAMYTTLLTVPQYLTEMLHRPPTEVGAILAALSVPQVVLGPLAGRLADQRGRRPVALVGSVTTLLALTPLLWIGPTWPSWFLIGPLVAAGCGLALLTPSIQAAALEGTPIHQAGVASGVYSTVRYLGSISGSALLAALLGGGVQTSTGGLVAVFAAIVAAAAAAVVGASLLPGGRPDTSLAGQTIG